MGKLQNISMRKIHRLKISKEIILMISEMQFNKKYIMSKSIYLVEKDDKMFLANSDNGMWVVVPKVNYEIMIVGLEEEKLQKYLESFNEQERQYLINFYSELIRIDILQEEVSKDKELKYKAATLVVTDTCNLQCKHCCQNAKPMTEEVDLGYECITNRFDKILKLNPDIICITGGEPMVREDFLKLAAYFRKSYKKQLILMTNGTLISSENVESIVQLFDSIDISIDGVDETSCSMIRGKNVFAKVMKCIELIKMKSNIPISLSMVLTRENQKLKKQFIELNKKLGTKSVLRPLAHSGRADENSTLFPEDNREYYIIENNSKQLSELRKEKRCRTCLAAKKSVFIDSDGSIYPCGALNKEKFCLENIDRLSIAEMEEFNNIVLDSKGYTNFLQIHPEKQDRCKNCSVSLFCYNCIERYDAEKNSVYFDDLCKKRKKLLEKLVWEEM